MAGAVPVPQRLEEWMAIGMATIEEFKAAWADKPNRDQAYAIAEQYVSENAAVLDPILGGKSSDELVKIVDLARAAGNDETATVTTMYELVKFERKQIGGAVNAVPLNPPKRKE